MHTMLTAVKLWILLLLLQITVNLANRWPKPTKSQVLYGECEHKLPELYEYPNVNKRTKFLLPILKWGPTNQVYGWFESCQLAHILNRTLVVPPMFQHGSVRGRYLDDINVPVGLRTNLGVISQNQPTVSLETYKKFCPETRTAFLTRAIAPNMMERIYQFQDATNFTFRHFEKLEKVGPVGEKNDWEPYLDNPDRCVVYVLPYRSIIRPENNILTDQAIDMPDYIHRLRKEFVTLSGSTDLHIDFTFHWRYNKGDWSQRCKSNFHKVPKECHFMKNLDDQAIEKVFSNHNLNSNLTAQDRTVLYISSPPSEANFIKRIVSRLHKTHPNNIYMTTADLKLWLSKHKVKNCEYARTYFEEVLSVLEQCILSSSQQFFPWPASSWSGRVVHLRPEKVRMKERGFTITDLIEKTVDLEKEHAEEF